MKLLLLSQSLCYSCKQIRQLYSANQQFCFLIAMELVNRLTKEFKQEKDTEKDTENYGKVLNPVYQN